MEIAWQIEVEQSVLAPAIALAGDETLLDDVACGQRPATARLWRAERCLVVPHGSTRHPRFDMAAANLAQSGWPVVLRGSGGSPVPLDRGTVNLSLVFPVSPDQGWQIDDGFRLLTQTLIASLAKLGFAATCGRVADAFCAGRFDLTLGGRKIAGTAQRWRAGQDARGQRLHAVLAHAVLLVASDVDAGIAALDQWSGLLDNKTRHDITRVTSLMAATKATTLGSNQLISSVIAALSQQLRPSDAGTCTARHSWAAI
jgi:lipoate-protein ligase A